MTSVRPPEEFEEDKTYPVVVGRGRIRELDGKQIAKLMERNMTLEQRVARLENILRREGLL